MKLGELTDFLRGVKDKTMPVVIQWPATTDSYNYGVVTPAGYLTSYRGYYDQLALTPGKTVCTVRLLLAFAEEADCGTFQGWKGGDYTMDRETSVWAADAGDAPSFGITGLVVRDGQVVVLTNDVSDYQGW
jgi:hypothetical protein